MSYYDNIDPSRLRWSILVGEPNEVSVYSEGNYIDYPTHGEIMDAMARAVQYYPHIQYTVEAKVVQSAIGI